MARGMLASARYRSFAICMLTCTSLACSRGRPGLFAGHISPPTRVAARALRVSRATSVSQRQRLHCHGRRRAVHREWHADRPAATAAELCAGSTIRRKGRGFAGTDAGAATLVGADTQTDSQLATTLQTVATRLTIAWTMLRPRSRPEERHAVRRADPARLALMLDQRSRAGSSS